MYEDEKIASVTVNRITGHVTVVTQKQEDEVYTGFGLFFFIIIGFLGLAFLPLVPLLIYLLAGKRWVWLGLFGLLILAYAYFAPTPILTYWWGETFILANSFSCVVIFCTLIAQSKKWWMKCIWMYAFLSIWMYGLSVFDDVLYESKNVILLYGYIGIKIFFLPLLSLITLLNQIFAEALFPFDYLKGSVTKFMFEEFFIDYSMEPGYKQFVKTTLPFAWLSMWVAAPFYAMQIRKIVR